MSSPAEPRICPTREDGEPPLIASWIDRAKCQTRQREHYHKCHLCVHRNAVAGAPAKPRASAARKA